jgi:hypothetical protein
MLSEMRARLAVQTKCLGTLDVLVDEAFDGRPGAASEGNTLALKASFGDLGEEGLERVQP